MVCDSFFLLKALESLYPADGLCGMKPPMKPQRKTKRVLIKMVIYDKETFLLPTLIFGEFQRFFRRISKILLKIQRF